MSNYEFKLEPQDVKEIKTAHRQIKTKIPVPESIDILNNAFEKESRSMHGQLPIIWDRAENFQVYDSWGNIWIDFTSSIFVANAGHANRRIKKALQKVLEKPLLHTYTYLSREREEYLDYLIENTPAYFEKAYLVSSGTEATETVLKLIRLNGLKNKKRKTGIICFEGNYHGRTMGAQMMSGNKQGRSWIGNDDENIHHLPFPYPWISKSADNSQEFFEASLNQLIKEKNLDPAKDISGIFLETFQGWAAVFYPYAYIKAIVKFANKHNILIAFDEMQAGFGRTGKLFGYMHYDIQPDLIACGKGVSSSLPLAIVLSSKEIMDLPDIGSMSSTNSANPLSCVAGHHSLKALIEDGLIENSKALGVILHKKLQELGKKYPEYISNVYGKGLLAGIIFSGTDNQPLSELCSIVCEKAMQRGLILVHTGRESIKIGPPLSITEDALIEGIQVLDECINDSIAEEKAC